jgi:tetratricopeptide (TPR) repeat protein
MRRLMPVPVLVFALCLPGAFAQQQQSSSDPNASSSPQPDKGCSAQATPGDKGSSKTSTACPPGNTPGKDVPASQPGQDAGQQPKKSTADDNPFPEDISEKAAADAKARDAEAAKPAPAAATGESSSRDKLDNLDLEGDRDSRIADGAGGIVRDPRLAAEDVHVGQFYLNREDYKGAYARFKEATQADPENAEAVYYLAEAARRMNHRDEAVQSYQLYLAALPDGPKAKEAKKALRDLNTSGKQGAH